MGDVVTLHPAARDLAGVGAEVVEISGPPAAFDGTPLGGLPLRDGDDVRIHYRAYEGRPEQVAVLFGPTTVEVVQALCRRLARSPERLIATAGPKLEQCWICDAEDRVAGARLALVKGLGWSLINVVLKKPDFYRGPTVAPRSAPAHADEPDTPHGAEPSFPDPLSGDDE